MIMSDSCKILDLDLVNCRKEDVNFTAQYSLNMKYTDRVHGLVAWFDTPFDRLERPVMLSTSPYKKYTHWKQTVFYMEEDLDVREEHQQQQQQQPPKAPSNPPPKSLTIRSL